MRDRRRAVLLRREGERRLVYSSDQVFSKNLSDWSLTDFQKRDELDKSFKLFKIIRG